jgi:hypothetical protein
MNPKIVHPVPEAAASGIDRPTVHSLSAEEPGRELGKATACRDLSRVDRRPNHEHLGLPLG